MRRQDIQLRALARQGDADACIRLAALYLRGESGTARNIALGLDYLRQIDPSRRTAAAHLVAGALRIDEIIAHAQWPLVALAAPELSAARLKLAVWLLLTGEADQALRLLRDDNSAPGRLLQTIWTTLDREHRVAALLRSAADVAPLDAAAVALAAAREVVSRRRFAEGADVLGWCLQSGKPPDADLCEQIVRVVLQAEQSGEPIGGLEVAHVRISLERLSARGHVGACHLLGRALCGIDCGRLPWQRLVESTNMRKGAALLLQAADTGIHAAWLDLYRVSADHRSSAANAQLARFCLEKAAACGIPEAQRRLGALTMREAESISDAERAAALLHSASQAGDSHATALLRSLVLPVKGRPEAALAAIARVHQHDPWLATRLTLSWHFGLTKQEALSVDPAAGSRPWGLIVGPNPFLIKARLSAPRVVPALTGEALKALREAAAFSTHARGPGSEGSLRARAAAQRRLFERLGLDETLFFASANATDREVRRVGSRWAYRFRAILQMALREQAAV